MMTILVVEDDFALRNGILYALKKEQFRTLSASRLSEIPAALSQGADVMILDVTLPDGDGREYLAGFRKESRVPVIFLTARDREADMLWGFDAGADDYITKPFSVPILIRRLKALIRRMEQPDGAQYRTGTLVYDFDKKLLLIDGAEAALTKTELRLLELLIQNRNQILTFELLLEKIWDIEGSFVDKNTLSVTVARLRKKLGDDPKNPKWLHNVFGIGYKWSDADEE